MVVPGIYENFFNASSEGIALVDADGIIETVNESFANIFGYTVVDLVGANVDQLVPMKHRPSHKSYRVKYAEKPAKRSLGNNRDLLGQRKDGSNIPVEISLSPIQVENVSKVVVMVTNISERKQMQNELNELNLDLQKKVKERTRELEASQQLYMQIARNFPNGIISVFDRKLNYVFVEGQELEKLGVTSDDLFGTPYLDRLPEITRTEVQEKLMNSFSNGGLQFEVEWDDQVFEMTTVPLLQEDEQTIQILVVERNVTTERKVQEEMSVNLAKEKELNELKSRFVSMASHEFRTPLTTISSSAQLISRYTDEEGQIKREKHVNRILGNVKHLTSVLNDILSISKLEEGHVIANPQQVKIADLLADVHEQMLLFNDGKTEIIFEVGEACDEFFCVDSNLLRNIIINLLSNAIKYSPEAETVRVTARVENENLHLSVIDRGIGIPIEEQNQLFNRFFRASNATNIEGTGLGLNIVQRLIEVLNGTITFESASGKGSTFNINIPNYDRFDISN